MTEPKQLENQALRFITQADAVGLGRLVVNGRFYGLPVDTVRDYEATRTELEALKLENANLRSALESKGGPGTCGALTEVWNGDGPYLAGFDTTDHGDLTEASLQKKVTALLGPLPTMRSK